MDPELSDALILFNGRELRAGSVEIHLRTRGWSEHNHHLNPAYDTVVLHVVGETATRRVAKTARCSRSRNRPGRAVRLAAVCRLGLEPGKRSCCAMSLATQNPAVLRETLFRLGDIRLAARSAHIEARLPSEPAAEILWAELLDGLGYSADREPMRALARLVSLAAIEDLCSESR